MEYDSVTIDTCVFDKHSLNLEGGILTQLTQFKNGYTHFILSEIVYREVRQHLIEKTKESKGHLKSAIDKVDKYKVASDDIVYQLRTILESFTSDALTAENRLKSFLEETGAEIVPVELVDIKYVTDHYFDYLPPFTEKKEKKHEFPDAIALLSLEKSAEAKEQKILAVSRDKGWHNFANNSKWIDIEEELATALAKLQQHAETANDFIAKFVADLDCGARPELMQQIIQFIDGVVSDSSSFEFESLSNYEYMKDYLDIEIEDMSFLKSEDKYQFSLVRTGKNLIVTSIVLSLSVTVTGHFTFFEWVSLDYGYRDIGDNICTAKDDLNVEILVTLEGDFSGQNNDLEITKTELVNLGTIDLGDIGPDYTGL